MKLRTKQRERRINLYSNVYIKRYNYYLFIDKEGEYKR